MKLIEIIQKLFQTPKCIIREFDGRVLIGIPRFFPYADESVAVGVRYVGNGEFVVDDCHTLSDYYSDFDIDYNAYRKEFDKILNENDLKFDEKFIWKTFTVTDENQLKDRIDEFVDLLFVLAKIEK